MSSDFCFVHIPKCAGTSISTILNIQPTHTKASRFDSSCFCFSFVRNPWDRCLSAYIYLKNGGINKNDEKDSAEYIAGLSFEQFITSKNFEKAVKLQQHFRTCCYYLDREIDFIGRFESLEKDFKILCNKINIKHEPLSLINASKHKHYRNYYNNKTIEIVYKNYRQDIERFKYEF